MCITEKMTTYSDRVFKTGALIATGVIFGYAWGIVIIKFLFLTFVLEKPDALILRNLRTFD